MSGRRIIERYSGAGWRVHTVMVAMAIVWVVAGVVIYSYKTSVLSGNQVEDVTDDPRYWGSFRPGDEYVTLCDLLFAHGDLADHFFWPGGQGRRIEFEEFLASPEKYSEVELVPAGCRVRCYQIKKIRSFNYSRLALTGQFVDGDRAGAIFDMFELSVPARGPENVGRVWDLNDAYIAPAAPPRIVEQE